MFTILKLSNADSIHTVRWANALASRGCNVHLLSIREPREPLDERITLHRAPWRAPAGYLLNAAFVKRKIQECRPDIVHAHFASGYGTLAGLVDHHPLIVSVWGADVYDFPVKSRLHSWLIRRALRKSDLLLSTSHAMAVQTKRYTDRDVHVTPFGIDLAQFRAQSVQSPFAPSDIVVGTVKTLRPKYGVEYLVRAFALVRHRHRDLPLKLLLVGGGPQQEELCRLAHELGISDVTTFTGHVDHGRVPQYQNMLSVSVSVSTLDSESFGVAVVEASACAKPVVVSNVGGLPEVVEDGVTGIVVPPRDAQATARAIEALVLDPELRKRMGAAGRKRVEDLYDWEACIDTMMTHYRTLVHDTRRSASAS